MIVKILEITIGTRSMAKPMDFWILVQLENGEIIEVFDLDPLDLRGYEDQYLDCLINPYICNIDKDTKYIFKGKYIENYELPLKWKGVHDPIENYSAVETENGIFLLVPGIFDFKDKDGQIIEFGAFRLDLLASLPLD